MGKLILISLAFWIFIPCPVVPRLWFIYVFEQVWAEVWDGQYLKKKGLRRLESQKWVCGLSLSVWMSIWFISSPRKWENLWRIINRQKLWCFKKNYFKKLDSNFCINSNLAYILILHVSIQPTRPKPGLSLTSSGFGNNVINVVIIL